MVRRLILGAYRYPIRTFLLVALLAVAGVFSLSQRSATGGTYSDNFWANNTTAMECAACTSCGCAAPTYAPEGVDVHSGELLLDLPLFSKPGYLGSTPFSLRWRSMLSGKTQLGAGIIPSWETTVLKVIDIPGAPNSANGHHVDVRRSSGRIDTFTWGGSAYVTTNCGLHDTLTTSGGAVCKKTTSASAGRAEGGRRHSRGREEAQQWAPASRSGREFGS